MTMTQLMRKASRDLGSNLRVLRAVGCSLLALFALTVFTTSPARAAIGTVDVTPAAT